jgi:hypothetical protein
MPWVPLWCLLLATLGSNLPYSHPPALPKSPFELEQTLLGLGRSSRHPLFSTPIASDFALRDGPRVLLVVTGACSGTQEDGFLIFAK